MVSAAAIERLLCGQVPTSNDFDDEKIIVLRGLARLIKSYYDFTFQFKQDLNASQSSYFMPVALRSLMETGTIALLARVDPIRVIHSSLCQNSGAYDRSKPQAAALKWRGDVVVDSQANPGNAPLVWDPAISGNKLPRHLLSEQYKEAFWKPAIANFSNWHTANGGTAQWAIEMAGLSPDDAYNTLLGGGKRTYSELSKGIHPEFAVRRETEFDAATLQNYLQETIKWISILGVVSHFSGGLHSGVPPELAYASLLEIEEAVNA